MPDASPPPSLDLRGSALDFGCGVGRLTQALADHFDEVWGVDIASSMIEGARRLDRSGGRCRYLVNGRPRVVRDASFGFILSLIVLQHLEPEYIRSYLREFIRLLAPDDAAGQNWSSLRYCVVRES
jgi:2-polyprenyl-3-methyl-5-hydroxy-6-metoxy-1,4-benzoquinol methylase